MKLTVFTPTYNRGHLLGRLYKSLCEQTILEQRAESPFEWVVVDDGSTDNTEELMQVFLAERKIPVRYVKKGNGGKHTAINRGAKEAEGDFFWILDSDDSLPANAIEIVLNYLPKMREMGADGICGYMAHHDGKIIGSPVVNAPAVMSQIEMRFGHGIMGDMMEVFPTSALRNFPFPEIEGERFCPEALVWFRIAMHYNLLLIPDVIYYRDYLDGGLTDNIVKIRMHSPIGTMMTYAEMFALDVPFRYKLRNAINYWRFAFCTKDRKVKIASWGKLLAPVGWLMHLNDKRRIGR